MSKETEHKLSKWEFRGDEEGVVQDLVYGHFESLAIASQYGAAKEGCNVFEIMFGDKVDEESAYGSVFYGIAGASWDAAVSAVALALSIPPRTRGTADPNISSSLSELGQAVEREAPDLIEARIRDVRDVVCSAVIPLLRERGYTVTEPGQATPEGGAK